MPDYDLVIRNGTVATAADTTACDIGIKSGVIATLGKDISSGAREIDATGKLVLPGGIDSHCHIEQLSANGKLNADSFASATISAAHGGTTTVIPLSLIHISEPTRPY